MVKKMEMHDVISKLEFMRNGYQKLIDENVDCGTIVGTDITGTWKAETPLNDVYKQHVEALDTAIKVLSAQPEIVRCKDCKHRPFDGEETRGFGVKFPDEKCPCQCDDGWYNWRPNNEWFCANVERKSDERSD